MIGTLRLLLLCGHLDDSVIAVGGIIQKVKQAGGRVDVVCFGNGDEGYSDVSKKDLIVDIFKGEAERAHRILGVDSFTCHDYPDFAVQENRETYRLCIEAIRRFKPDVIMSHYWAEYFQHRAMARLACDSWWQAGWGAAAAELGKPWRARALYHFEIVHLLPEPTHIVDVSDTFSTKLEAFQAFESQLHQLGDNELGDLTAQIEARGRYYGSLIGVRYGEALKRSSYLPEAVASPDRL